MEQELFTTAQIAADLEHKSKNPNRDVLNIAKRLGFSPVDTRTHVRNGKPAGGMPEKLWSKEQRDAILADNQAWHKKPAQILSPVVTTVAHVVAEPALVVEEISLGQRADRIRQLQADIQRGIIEIGHELIAAKKQVGHGDWGAWLDKEFKWTDRTARNFMAIAERFGNRKSISVFSPTTLIKMLALPEGDEEKFIDAQAAAGKPVEKQSAREVQRNVSQWKQRQSPKKDSGNAAPVVELPPARADVPADDPTPDLNSDTLPASNPLPAQMDTPTVEDTNVVASPAQVAAILKLIDETNDDQQLSTLKIALTNAIFLIDAKRAGLAQKN